MTNPVAKYDFVLFNYEDVDALKSWCKYVCKEWAFQLELTPTTENKHFQGYLNLKEKMRKSTLVKKLPDHLKEMSIRPLHDADGGDPIVKYVTKSETRIDGPWMSDNLKPKVNLGKRKKFEITEERKERWVKRWEETVLRPWQEKAAELLDNECPRTIHWIYNKEGNAGKSYFTAWALNRHGAVPIGFGKAADIKYTVSNFPSKAYIFDLARNATVDMGEIYNALEDIKNGTFLSKSYCNPSMLVFSHHTPDFASMSADRWKIWTIVDDDLVPWTTEISPACGFQPSAPL
jgi:hypothetical protein